jgi:ribonuclease Y
MDIEIFTLSNIIIILIGLVAGFLISKILDKNSASTTINNAKSDAERIINSSKIEGENLKKDKIFQAKERFLELKSEHEKHILNREKDLTEVQKRIKDKESLVSNELALNKKNNQSLSDKVNSFNKKIELFEKKNVQVEKMQKEQINKLEK